MSVTLKTTGSARADTARRAGIAPMLGVRGLVVATLLATGGLASGCASGSTDSMATGSVGNDYRTRHPIVVSQSEVAEDIVVSTNARRLSRRDEDLTTDFAKRFRRSGAKSLAVMIPSGSQNEEAARHIAHEITRVLQDKGVAERQIYIHHYQAADYGEAATVRLVYADIRAEVASECGQWDENIIETSENRNYANFGCTTQKNLAAIVANPADLLGPRGETEIDSGRRTTVIEDWQENGSGDLPTLFDN